MSTHGADLQTGAISFASTVNGAHTLAVNTGGVTTFGGAVGGVGTAVTSVTTDEPGTTLIIGGGVATTGAQSYGENVSLGANTALTTANSDIHFHGAIDGIIDGVSNLTLDSGSGDVRIDGAVGNTTALASLTINGTGTTDLSGGSVITTGAQTYNQAVGVYDDTDFITGGGAVTFANTLTGFKLSTPLMLAPYGRTLFVDAKTGDVTLGGDVNAGNITLWGNKVSWNADLNGTDLQVIGTNLVMNGDVNSSGANGVLMVAADAFKNEASHTITLTGGGKYLIYSVTPTRDIPGGLPGTRQFSTTFADGPAPAFIGSGFLYSMRLPPGQQSYQITNDVITFDVPRPDAGTHGGGFFSVINTPTHTRQYRQEHRKKGDREKEDGTSAAVPKTPALCGESHQSCALLAGLFAPKNNTPLQGQE